MPERFSGYAIARVIGLVLVIALPGCTTDGFIAAAMQSKSAAPEIKLLQAVDTPFDLKADMPPVTLVYFGYTHCPDVCPLTMGNLAAARHQLSEKDQSRVRVVMVTADPERDTPAIMDRYVKHYDPSFIGLSGPPADVDAVLAAWAVPVEREAPDADGAYAVSHPASVNVLDGRGRLRLIITSRLTVDDIAHDLRALIQEQG